MYTAFHFLWMAYPHLYFTSFLLIILCSTHSSQEGISLNPLLSKSPVTSILINLMIHSLCSSVPIPKRDLPLLWDAVLVASPWEYHFLLKTFQVEVNTSAHKVTHTSSSGLLSLPEPLWSGWREGVGRSKFTLSEGLPTRSKLPSQISLFGYSHRALYKQMDF